MIACSSFLSLSGPRLVSLFLFHAECIQRSVGVPLWLLQETEVQPLVAFPPCVITMRGFGHYRDRNKEWYSQPFYTWPSGYKLCMKVYANGYRDSWNTHFLVFVYIMRGENDATLHWPFEGKVTLSSWSTGRRTRITSTQ